MKKEKYFFHTLKIYQRKKLFIILNKNLMASYYINNLQLIDKANNNLMLKLIYLIFKPNIYCYINKPDTTYINHSLDY